MSNIAEDRQSNQNKGFVSDASTGELIFKPRLPTSTENNQSDSGFIKNHETGEMVFKPKLEIFEERLSLYFSLAAITSCIFVTLLSYNGGTDNCGGFFRATPLAGALSLYIAPVLAVFGLNKADTKENKIIAIFAVSIVVIMPVVYLGYRSLLDLDCAFRVLG